MASKLGPPSLLERLAETHDDDVLRQGWFKAARRRFREISDQEAWLRLDADIVRELLNDDEELRDVGERVIYQAVLKWLAENRDQLAAQVDRLLGVVRFSAMGTEDKFKCLDEAKRFDLQMFVKPYLIEADWYRTCMELNCPEFTDLVEFDRSQQFVGEGRRTRAIEMQLNTVSARRRPRSISVVTIETKPTALERATLGKINADTVVARPRPERSLSVQDHFGKAPRSRFRRSPKTHRLPSEHLQFWRNEMHALAETSNDQQRAAPPPILPMPSSAGSSRIVAGKESKSSIESSRPMESV